MLPVISKDNTQVEDSVFYLVITVFFNDYTVYFKALKSYRQYFLFLISVCHYANLQRVNSVKENLQVENSSDILCM